MPRPKRADEAGAIYHALNRGNARSPIFHKEGDYQAFEQILGEGLAHYAASLLAYQLMPNHWHLVLQPRKDGAGWPRLLCNLGLVDGFSLQSVWANVTTRMQKVVWPPISLCGRDLQSFF